MVFPFFALLLLFFILFLLVVFLIYNLPLFLGAPFVTTPDERVKKILKLASPKKGEILYDLGSGDGRIVVGAAKTYGVKAFGIEINPILVWLSRRRIKKLGLENQAEIFQGNFFHKNFSDADIVITYLLQTTNENLEKKFLRELKPGARIVSESFTFRKIPFLKSSEKESSLRLYQIPSFSKNVSS